MSLCGPLNTHLSYNWLAGRGVIRLNGHQILRRKYARWLIVYAVVLRLPLHSCLAQTTQPSTPVEVPAELQATDPEIRKFLTEATLESRKANYRGAQLTLQKALNLAKTRGNIRDQAVTAWMLGSMYFMIGDLNKSFDMLQNALQNSIDSHNEALESMILAMLASFQTIRGDISTQEQLLSKALRKANESKSRYARSAVLGGLAWMLINQGQPEKALPYIEEAVNIDRVNGFDLLPLHLAYRATAISQGTREQKADPLKAFREAAETAIQQKNIFALLFAEKGLAFTYIFQKQAAAGIAILERLVKGNVEQNGVVRPVPELVTALEVVPLVKLFCLESLADGYEMAGLSAQAIKAWTELYDFSRRTGLSPARGEAAEKIADFYERSGNLEQAVMFYSDVIEAWRDSGNATRVLEIYSRKASLLIKLRRWEEALSTEKQLMTLAEKENKIEFQWSAYLGMAQVFKEEHNLAEERAALEAAQALLQSDTLRINDQSALRFYLALSDTYKRAGDEPREIVALEKAAFVAAKAKEGALLWVIRAQIEEKLRHIDAETAADRFFKGNHLYEALLYSELVFAYKGVPPAGLAPAYWQYLWKVPFELVKQPGGASVLADNLKDMGVLLGVSKLPILEALAWYYLYVEGSPQKSRQYASAGMTVAEELKGSSQISKLFFVCYLATADAQMSNFKAALQEAGECVDLGRGTGDESIQVFVHATDALVHIYAGNMEGAEPSLQFFLARDPQNAQIRWQLAMALAAAGHLREAKREWAAAVDMYKQKEAKTSLAQVYFSMGLALYSGYLKSPNGSGSQDFLREALRAFVSAAEVFAGLSDPLGEARAIAEAAKVLLALGEAEKAARYAEKARAIAEQLDNKPLQGFALLLLGKSSAAKGNAHAAAKYYKLAMAILFAAGDLPGQVEALRLLAASLEQLNQNEEAESALREAIAIATKGAISPMMQHSLVMNLALLTERQGKFPDTAALLNEAMSIATNTGDDSLRADTYLGMADFDSLLGDWERAAQEASAALDLYQKTANVEGQANALSDLVSIYGDRRSSVKNFDRALEYYRKLQSLKPSREWAADLVEIYTQTGQLAKARFIAEADLQECRKSKDVECEAHDLISLAEIRRLSGDYKGAAESLTRASSLVNRKQDIYLEGRFLYQQANYYRAVGQPATAVDVYAKLIELIETRRHTVPEHVTMGLAASYDYIYGELIDTLHELAVEKGSPHPEVFASLAFEYAEKNKARKFSQLWGRAFLSSAARVVPGSILAREETLTEKRNNLQARLKDVLEGKGENADNPNQLQRDLEAVEAQLNELVAALWRDYPQYAVLKYPKTFAPSEIPLKQGELLVEFKMTDPATFVWLVKADYAGQPNVVAFYKVAKTRSWFEQRILKLRDVFNSGKPEAYDPTMAKELFDALFPEPYAHRLLTARRILWVPDDILWLIPLELLSPQSQNGQYSLLAIPTEYFPSASSVVVARTAGHLERAKEGLWGVGDPVTKSDSEAYDVAEVLFRVDPRNKGQKVSTMPESVSRRLSGLQQRGFMFFGPLPWTRTELQAIAQLFVKYGQTASVLTGLSATKTTVLDTDLSRFRYLHFATHGVLPSDGGITEPSLVLSYDGRSASDMFLTMSEILQLKLNADSVVLSACNTGVGKVVRAEGVMSLGRAFLAAGAASVTVSLWEVDDRSTSLFMEKYYRRILTGVAKSEALSLARQSLFEKGYRNPFYWAPFILIGE
jgi:tetratricopeptide (TPR) repeat protein